jgi:hypothetical protein
MAINYVAVGAGAIAGAVLLPVIAPVVLPILGVGAVLGMLGITTTAGLGALVGGFGAHFLNSAVTPPPVPPAAPTTKLTP